MCVCQLEEDQGFKEFLLVHQNRSQVPTWANDTTQQTTDPTDDGRTKTQGKKKLASEDDYLNFDSDQSEEEDEEKKEEEEEDDDEEEGW